MGEDQLDDLELDGPITLRILDGTAWDFTQAKWWRWWKTMRCGFLNSSCCPRNPHKKAGNEEEEYNLKLETIINLWLHEIVRGYKTSTCGSDVKVVDQLSYIDWIVHLFCFDTFRNTCTWVVFKMTTSLLLLKYFFWSVLCSLLQVVFLLVMKLLLDYNFRVFFTPLSMLSRTQQLVSSLCIVAWSFSMLGKLLAKDRHFSPNNGSKYLAFYVNKLLE